VGHVARGVGCYLVVVLVQVVPGRPSVAEEAAGASVPSREAYEATTAGPARLPAPRLRLVWIDVLRSAPYAYAAASREAAAILGAAGVEAAWTAGDASTVTGETELKIVLMMAVANGAGLPERVMGGTLRGGQSHTAWIYLSNVLWALGLPDRGARGLSRSQEDRVALALGRVIAHEVVHAVAPELPHGRTGLMARTIGRSLLLQARVALAPGEERALRAGVAAFLAPPAASGDAVARAAWR
jgi:hypothetical protein